MALTFTDAVILGAILQGIFYGAYTVLFILYMALLRRNNHTVDRRLILAQILLFGLCTLFLCLDVSGDFFQVVPDTEVTSTADKVNAGATALFSIIDCLAQLILLYRCWIIWDKRLTVVAVPGFLAFASLGAGLTVSLVDAAPSGPIRDKIIPHMIQTGTAAYFISLGVNALTTSLIVIKILLISREVRPVLGSTGMHRSSRVVIAMILESGLLILVSQLVYVVLFLIVRVNIAPFCLVEGPITQIYGITPTLLNIRAVMGSSYNTGTVGSLNFVCADGAVAQTDDRSSGTVTIHTRDINIESNNDLTEKKIATESAV